MRQRSERRNLEMSKWVSKLKKIWNSYSAFDTVRLVKDPNYRCRNNDSHRATSYVDLKSDRYGVMLRNTRTINRKFKDIKETRKRNLENRIVPSYEQDAA